MLPRRSALLECATVLAHGISKRRTGIRNTEVTELIGIPATLPFGVLTDAKAPPLLAWAFKYGHVDLSLFSGADDQAGTIKPFMFSKTGV